MKINKKTKKGPLVKYIFVALVALITLGLLVSIYFFWTSKNTPNKPASDGNTVQTKIDLDPPTTEQVNAGQDIKKAANDENKLATFGVYITSANINNNIVQIRAVINGLVSSDDTCLLTLTKDVESIQKTAPTYALPSSSTCQGFDVSISELSTGTWSINLSVTASNETANAVSEITIP